MSFHKKFMKLSFGYLCLPYFDFGKNLNLCRGEIWPSYEMNCGTRKWVKKETKYLFRHRICQMIGYKLSKFSGWSKPCFRFADLHQDCNRALRHLIWRRHTKSIGCPWDRAIAFSCVSFIIIRGAPKAICEPSSFRHFETLFALIGLVMKAKCSNKDNHLYSKFEYNEKLWKQLWKIKKNIAFIYSFKNWFFLQNLTDVFGRIWNKFNYFFFLPGLWLKKVA